MVQGTIPETAAAPARLPVGEWLGRTTEVLRDAVLPEERDDATASAGSTAGDGGSTWPGRVGRLAPRLTLILAVGLLAVAFGLFGLRAVFADRVYPAVAVGDVAVGGMTVDQAVAAVEQRAAELERGTVTFTYQGQTWTPTLSELGANVDVDASVDAAYALGRDDNAVTRLGFAGDLLRGDQQVPLRTTIDRDVLAIWFTSVNADIDQRAVDAALVVDGADVTISPEHSGIVVDEAAATRLILGALGELAPVTTKLPTMTELPRIYAAELDGPRSDLATAIKAPVVVTFEDQTWKIKPADLAGFLTVETTSGASGPEVTLGFKRDALAAYLRETYSGDVNRAPVDARIAWSAEQGGLVSLDPSVNGAALRANAFAGAVAESFLGDRKPVEVPIVVTKPKVDSNNLGALGIDGLLARGDSNFVGGSQTRDNNIYVGVDLMNGELIAPGEEFSFNRAVGEITYEKGFVDAGVIENGIIGRDVGGGICQVSTTVFRAALLSGMPITEWHYHSLRLSGYERDGWTAGFDAAILQSGPDPQYWGDFRFKNDTDGYMLVQSWTDYPHVIVEIYGNDDGRTVDLSQPQFASPSGNFVAWFTRVVTFADGTTGERTFESYYK
jgi:vancomycin resistance protein YoaR